jgi:hypothetical protein
MTTAMRLRAAGLLSGLGVVAALSGSGLARQDARAIPAPALDRALAANDLNEARRLVPENWAATEQLLVFYLEQAFLPSDPLRSDPDARARADRLADVFFRIIEYDFAQAIVSALDGADLEKRRGLIGTTRDYFVALERLRAMASEIWLSESMSDPAQLGPEFYDIAGRFRVLGVRRAELHTLCTMLNVGAGPGPDGLSSTARANRLADELGDDLSLVLKRPFTEASLSLAERLGLPGRQGVVLEALGLALQISTEPAKLQQAATYLERASAIERGLPPFERVSSFPSLLPSRDPR